MNELLLAALLGLLGGVVRSVVGLLKSMAAKRKIVWLYWLVTVVASGLVGVMTGIIFSYDPRLSVLAGYAGTDLLEGVYKMFKVQKFYSMPSGKK